MNPFSFPSIGVDISDESFKFVRLENKNGLREISFYGSKDLPAGIVTEGEIGDVKELSSALKDGLSQYHSRHPYLIMSLPEEKGFLRVIRMQKIPHKEVRAALEFQIEEHIPYPPHELVFDFHVLPERHPDGEMSVVVMAYPQAIVFSYVEVVRLAGFVPVVFELESQAVSRAVVPHGSDEAMIVGDIGRTRTTFSIVYRGSVHFTSTIKVGGRDIDKILSDSLHISEDEAKKVKFGRGLDFSSEDIIQSLSPALTRMKEEIERQIGYWDHRTQPDDPSVGKIYLCGGDAHLKGLPEFFSQETGLPAMRAKIWENIFDLTRTVPSMHAHESLRFATAFGLAMRGDEDFFHI